MNICFVGGGPGGLYCAILIKKSNPSINIDIYERNDANDSFGFGVVFSDETLGEFLYKDPESYELIRSSFAYWDDIVVARDGKKVNISGNGFCGCSRKTLLKLLHKRCYDLGINLYFNHLVDDFSQLQNYDYIIASDGINSAVREKFQSIFKTKINLQTNKFVWMGSTKPLDAFTYFFKNTSFGTIVAHTYQYQEGMSTWIFECSNETFNKIGFDTYNESDSIEKLSKIFKNELDGHPLISNKSHWRQFPEITNEKWHHENIFLLGDAKATAHFSIGSGTKLAMESAISLAEAILINGKNHSKAAEYYYQNRKNKVEIIQHAAKISSQWFEKMDRYINQPFYQFAFGVMTRSKKVTFENLHLRDSSFTQKVLEEYNLSRNQNTKILAPFSEYHLRNITLSNKIVMAPMGQYKAIDGIPNDWHFVHYTSRAIGGVGLIITEMTAVNPEGRITKNCTGIYNQQQVEAWKNINHFIHQNTSTKIALQIGHSGRKGNSKVPFDSNDFTIDPNWKTIAASAIPFTNDAIIPNEMSIVEMNLIENDFVQATINADLSHFDMIEIQAHHGFLLASFLSPLTNLRQDEFGGSIENRMKFPLRIIKAVRDNFPQEKPISVRISANDWAENGISEQDVLRFCNELKKLKVDIINVSTGNTISDQKMPVGRMWQVPFSDWIKNEVDIPTITTGGITELDQINTIILSGKADLVSMGKMFLINPYFVREAEAKENFQSQTIPEPYSKSYTQIYPTIASNKILNDKMKKALKPESHQYKQK